MPSGVVHYGSSKSRRNLYAPDKTKQFKLSRSKIDSFIKCPRCFYLDMRLGIGQPPGPPFRLNSAVDTLLKQEFDIHRADGTKHPLLKSYGVDAVPVHHEKLHDWRENFVGIQYCLESENVLVFGAIDDLWQNPAGEYIVVDYKATSKKGIIDHLEGGFHEQYKRQVEIYQWLLRKNGCNVSDTAYFVYCNGLSDKKAFDAKLEFDVRLIAYEGNDGWVEKAILDAIACLKSDKIPEMTEDCAYCRYNEAVSQIDE